MLSQLHLLKRTPCGRTPSVRFKATRMYLSLFGGQQPLAVGLEPARESQIFVSGLSLPEADCNSILIGLFSSSIAMLTTWYAKGCTPSQSAASSLVIRLLSGALLVPSFFALFPSAAICSYLWRILSTFDTNARQRVCSSIEHGHLPFLFHRRWLHGSHRRPLSLCYRLVFHHLFLF